MKKYKFKVYLKSSKTPATDKRVTIEMTFTTQKIPYEQLEAEILKEIAKPNVIAWECRDLK